MSTLTESYDKNVKHPWEDKVVVRAVSLVSNSKDRLERRIHNLENQGWDLYISGTIEIDNEVKFGAYLTKDVVK